MGPGVPVSSILVPTSQLLLIRHGESTWNAEGRWQGRQDPPLSQLGIRQARAAASVLGSFDLIAASTLQRAFTTAGIVADELGVGPVVGDVDLVERFAGVWEGLTRGEIEERWPGYLAEGRRPDDYESDEAIVARAAGALGRIAGQVAGGTALVVSHGGVIMALERAVGAPRHGPATGPGGGRTPNLGGRWFEIGPGHLVAGEAVNLAGDVELDVVE